jgi:phytoene dehydrogenase-like protein
MAAAPEQVVVIGAGAGGLAAAARLARLGWPVVVLEARGEPGGLASGLDAGGLAFDGGPYVLLDRPGLEWAFGRLGVDLEAEVPLCALDPVYTVQAPDRPPVTVAAGLAETAAGFDRLWPGSGRRYRRWVEGLIATYRDLAPLQRVAAPGPRHLLAGRRLRRLPFLLRSLAAELGRSGLPAPLTEALGIWTHVAGQSPAAAPSAMALVPALIHSAGAFAPRGGMGAVVAALAAAARAAGAEVRYGVRVARIRCRGGRAVGVETAAGDFLAARAVVSNHHGVGTYLGLVEEVPERARRRLASLPLQSPGVCAYLTVRGAAAPSYLTFRLPGGGELCRLFVQPAALDPAPVRDGWAPARLLAPMRHAEAERLGRAGQEELLERLLAEDWWRPGLAEVRVVARRLPADWGAEFTLHRDSMNPVMTAALLRAGRLAHRSPWVRGLYLAGSSTHPGQWVSFCAISGVLAADLLDAGERRR